jgi:putative Mg2+ transporter-C (MgtC) family protein
VGSWQAWTGDINAIPGIGREAAGLISVGASILCGALVGLERERRDKPAGLRTLMLICLGSTIYTLVSLLLASRREMADPARLAAQILPGIGFLGAGAIIRARGTVVGLTTGATIWAVAAVGVTIGAGYVAAGLVFTSLVLITLTTAQRMEWIITGRCSHGVATVTYRPEHGKTWPRLQSILDDYRTPTAGIVHGQATEDQSTFRTRVCMVHREHRSVLRDIADVPKVLGIEVDPEPPRRS